MKKKTALSQKIFQTRLAGLWPALKGSLSQVRKPCIRPNCPACASGQKHLAYMLSFTEEGTRRCMYVPDALAPLLRRGLRNGRAVEQLLSEIGPALIQEHRKKRERNAEVHQKPSKSGTSSKRRESKS